MAGYSRVWVCARACFPNAACRPPKYHRKNKKRCLLIRPTHTRCKARVGLCFFPGVREERKCNIPRAQKEECKFGGSTLAGNIRGHEELNHNMSTHSRYHREDPPPPAPGGKKLKLVVHRHRATPTNNLPRGGLSPRLLPPNLPTEASTGKTRKTDP